MIEMGRVCVKIAGRDSGKYCVIVEQIDEVYVTVTGEVKRGKCNIQHLDLLPLKLDINKKDSDEKIVEKMIESNVISSAPKFGDSREDKKKKLEIKEAKPKQKTKENLIKFKSKVKDNTEGKGKTENKDSSKEKKKELEEVK